MFDGIHPITPEFDLKAVGRRLRLAREHAGLSQQHFGESLGYSRRQVNAWEHAVHTPPIWVLLGVRRLCHVSPDWILFGPGEEPLEFVPSVADRTGRVRRELVAMAKEYGLRLPDKSFDNFTAMIVREPIESEKEAKKWVRRALRALL